MIWIRINWHYFAFSTHKRISKSISFLKQNSKVVLLSAHPHNLTPVATRKSGQYDHYQLHHNDITIIIIIYFAVTPLIIIVTDYNHNDHHVPSMYTTFMQYVTIQHTQTPQQNTVLEGVRRRPWSAMGILMLGRRRWLASIMRSDKSPWRNKRDGTPPKEMALASCTAKLALPYGLDIWTCHP